MSQLNRLFKYEAYFQLHQMANCPPITYEEQIITAYRYIFDNLNDDRNFKPVYILDKDYPKRLNAAKDMEMKCKGFGLSLYQNKNGAIANYKRWMAKTNGKFAKIVGSYVATVQIMELDGVCSEIENEDTHFTFFEYETANLIERIEGKPDLLI
jgi:hypothetical protein